jgi:hypothetical protein
LIYQTGQRKAPPETVGLFYVAGDLSDLTKSSSFASWWAHEGMNLFGKTVAIPSVLKMTVGEQMIDHADRPTLHIARGLCGQRQQHTTNLLTSKNWRSSETLYYM